jgi:hypothetical protein
MPGGADDAQEASAAAAAASMSASLAANSNNHVSNSGSEHELVKIVVPIMVVLLCVMAAVLCLLVFKRFKRKKSLDPERLGAVEEDETKSHDKDKLVSEANWSPSQSARNEMTQCSTAAATLVRPRSNLHIKFANLKLVAITTQHLIPSRISISIPGHASHVYNPDSQHHI